MITKPILAFLIVAATGHFAMGVFEVLWSLWLRHLGASIRYIGFTWVAFSAPMLLSFVGGYLADRYNRWALMFSGFTVSAFAWIIYGTTDNLTLFLVVNIVEGLAVAWSYPAKQGFLVQVVPPRWLGSVQGMEQSVLAGGGPDGHAPGPGALRLHVGLRHQPGRSGVAGGLGRRGAHPSPGMAPAQGRVRNMPRNQMKQPMEIPLRQL